MGEREQNLLEQLEDVREERDALLDRIAELEAELAGFRSEYQATRGFLSKAEAEVERLKVHLRGCCGEDYESCEAIA